MVLARPHIVEGSTICERRHPSTPTLFNASATSFESDAKIPVLYGSRMVLYSILLMRFSSDGDRSSHACEGGARKMYSDVHTCDIETRNHGVPCPSRPEKSCVTRQS